MLYIYQIYNHHALWPMALINGDYKSDIPFIGVIFRYL